MTAIDLLASRAGIEEEFRDATGETRRTSLETKQALLSAMGIGAGDEESARRSLEALDREDWSRALPTVRVAYALKAISVAVVVPTATTAIRWCISLECGDERTGAAHLTRSTRMAAYDLNGRPLERHRIVFPQDTPYGYHRLRCELDDSVCTLIVTPGRCWLPEAAHEGRRLWGVSAQLYLLRSKTNWGIGDFGDLRQLAKLVGNLGGDIVGLNPLHAMFLDNPEHASPYSPENRLLLNVLNIDVEAVPELRASPEAARLIASEEFQKRLEECRASTLVDYAGVAALKLQALKLLFECCRTAADSQRWTAFECFRRQAGPAFEQSCVFEALRQHFACITGKPADWHAWPADYQNASSPAVARFAEEHAGSVTLYAWLQWLADQQLQTAAAACRDMQVGLYRDLAVGTDSCGAATWSNPAAVVSKAHVGAPPDVFNPAGQDWGLPPFNPRVLFQTAYQSFIDLLRANMRHAGGLRIDHIMALQRLYWVPEGRSPREGAYIRQPLEDLAGILALESQRNRCLIVGEDLGTVPEGFRERMREANILSYRVLLFEQDSSSGEFVRPEDYPRLSVTVVANHDLPTIRGWWEGADIEIKERLHLFPSAKGASEARHRRERDKRELVRALHEERLLPDRGQFQVEHLADAVHAYVARTSALLTITQLDDVTAEVDPVNVPGTSDEHPNWRRRLWLTLEQLAEHPRLNRLASMFAVERGS